MNHHPIKIKLLLSLLLLITCHIFAQETDTDQSYLLLLKPENGALSLEDKTALISKQAAQKAILDESLEPYFSQLQIREIECFVQQKCPSNDLTEARAFARTEFAKAVLPFSNTEAACMQYVISGINAILLENDLGLMARQDWKFIKIDNSLCGGFGHTRGDYIILSQRHLDHLCQNWGDSLSNTARKKLLSGIGSLIVHEQVHGLQRNYPEVFKRLNTQYWNFVEAEIAAEEEIMINQVSNPDAPVAKWLIPNPKNPQQYYWCRTLLKEGIELPQMGKDFEDVVFRIEKENEHYKIIKDEEGKAIRMSTEDIPFYTLSYPVKRGIDHPNEIAAYMFADYYKALVLGDDAFAEIEESAKANTQAFLRWLLTEMP